MYKNNLTTPLEFTYLPRPKLCLGERYCFTLVSLWFCLSIYLFIYLWLCDQDNSKSSQPIFMKFGRTLSYYKIKVKFKFEKKNRNDRAQTTPKRNFKNAIFKNSFKSISIKSERTLFYYKINQIWKELHW